MKNSLTAFLPALALLALSGCASTGAIATSEDDGVYYSSKDRNTAIVTPAPAASTSTASNEAANPDYNGAPATAGSSQQNQKEYYDDSYATSRSSRTYVYSGPGVAYYAPPVYAPYTTLSYSYGWGGGYCGYSPYGSAFYDPFYSPFYSPYYGYGSGVTISFGYGRPWGYGGYYSPYYGYGYGSPWAYGYGGYYDPYYYGGRYYGGYYGPRGYYGSNYYGNAYYGNGGYRKPITTGHRTDRMSSGGRVNTTASSGGTSVPSSSGGGRVRTGGRSASIDGPTSQPMPNTPEGGGRVRTGEQITSAPMPASYSTQPDTKPTRVRNEPQQLGSLDQPANQPANQPVRMSPENTQPTGGGKRWRGEEMSQQMGQATPAPQPQPMTQPASMPDGGERKPRREYSAPADASYATPDGYAQPQRMERPARQRSYDAPSYDRPQRAEQPTYSAPTYSSPSYGGGGGGNNGGGGGSPRRGRAN